ncbi:hypothetical protein ACSBR1_026647 [Camellia fascicularis]
MPQANAASGMAVEDDCKLKFLELKTKRNYRFIIFKIEGQNVAVEKLGSPEESYEDFTASLPADECRYAVFDFDFITDENCQKSKIFFIAWAHREGEANEAVWRPSTAKTSDEACHSRLAPEYTFAASKKTCEACQNQMLGAYICGVEQQLTI